MKYIKYIFCVREKEEKEREISRIIFLSKLIIIMDAMQRGCS